MNKVITDGVVLMPPVFGDGLDVWSSADGRPGDPAYDGAANATLVAADADFATCLELLKTETIQKLRSMAETPLSTGCYLRVRVRVKAVAGVLPSVRIAAWAGGAGGNHIAGVVDTGPAVPLTTYGDIVEVSAIVGSGPRTGVDMVWGRDALFGHFGIDLIGNIGGVVRVEDITIEDVTAIFQGKVIDVVDVKDFGAVGDGVTDDRAAFEAADAAANGRDILVSDGSFYLGQTVTFSSRIRFQGKMVMPDNAILQLTQNYDYGTYLDAFGDEQLAFKKAFQALMNFTDHESLDLCGYSIRLTDPVDLHAVVGNRDTFATRRVLRNGQFITSAGPAWDDDVVSSSASYDVSSKFKLTNVTNAASIPVGALVEGFGVGREVYVKEVNANNNTLTLSKPLWGANASQTYTFKRFKYMLDMSGFTSVSRFTFEDIEFNGGANASAIMLPIGGLIMHFKDCFFTANKDRCITSIGTGCSGMLVDRCQFLSNEQSLNVADRHSIAFNTNANDVKIRNNRAIRYKHFGVVGGSGNIISGNHFFQGDNADTGERTAGMIIANVSCKSTFTANYVDNCSLEWTNEYDETPDLISGFSFSTFTITGNIFFSSGSQNWFRFLKIKPFGTGQYLNGVTITDNLFKVISSINLERVEGVDTTHADLNHSKDRNVIVTGNSYLKVDNRMQNPVTLSLSRSSVATTWVEDMAEYIPFGGQSRAVVSVAPEEAILDGVDAAVYELPYAQTGLGSNGSEVALTFSRPTKGKIWITARSDNPI